jgi:hypothetical protein
LTSLPLLPVPFDGQEFLDLDAVGDALDDWAVKEKFSYRMLRRDVSRGVWVCTYEAKGCSWRCRASWDSQEELWSLAILKDVHTCLQATQRTHSPASKINWLNRIIFSQMAVSQDIILQHIINLVKTQYAEIINYKQA